MALVPITTYGAAWNPTTNQGRVFIQIGTGQPTPIPIDSADEFLITVLMLGKTGVQFDSQTREIAIPFRSTGT